MRLCRTSIIVAFVPLLVMAYQWTTSAVAAEPAGRRPNVLFIVADDLNCSIGPYGDSVASTPNLDRLAGRGLTFDRAYCQQAVCNPSRTSFLTGRRPDRIGVNDLKKYFRDTALDGDSLMTLPEHFKRNGYFCQCIGKIFHNTGNTQDRRSWSVDEVLYKGTHGDDTVYRSRLRGERGSMKAPVTESLNVSDSAYRDGRIAKLAADALREQATKVEPFFIAVGFWRPHLPFVAPKRYWDRYDPNEIPMPNPPERPTNVPDIAIHDSREIRSYGERANRLPFDDAKTRHYRHGYYASISFMDAQVGILLDALKQSGQSGNTIVVFTSDHGFHIGEHSMWGKTSNFELDARVPLIIADHRTSSSAGGHTHAICELIDLYPTLAELAGIATGRDHEIDGVSLASLLANPESSVKSAAFTQHQQPFYGGPRNWKAWGQSVRTDRWRYTRWTSTSDGQQIANELYDHENDPLETQNVASDPANQSLISKMTKLLSKTYPQPAQ